MSVETAEAEELNLRPCKHQVAGHLFEEGKAGSLVDDSGHFYKPRQVGPRGERELAFYEHIARELQNEKLKAAPEIEPRRWLHDLKHANSLQKGKRKLQGEAGSQDERKGKSSGKEIASFSGRVPQEDSVAFERRPFSQRHAVLLSFIPRFYGVVELSGKQLIELEDLTRCYRHPSIADIKVGTRTWYSGADPKYIERCKLKDAATTQSVLGFKVCGMQVYRHFQGGYWRASKRWCKQMPQENVQRALIKYANNEVLAPKDVYGGPKGAIAHLQRLESWFQLQRDFCFYSSSVLLIYEGDAETAEEANVSVRLVDFAHTFPSEGKEDSNFLVGLQKIIRALKSVMQDPEAGQGADSKLMQQG